MGVLGAEQCVSRVPGGHLRIFRTSQLKTAVTNLHMRFLSRHWAHSLHVPYWWLRCAFWQRGEQTPIVARYHRLLVWDLMQKPWITRTLERVLNPLLGKSVAYIFATHPTLSHARASNPLTRISTTASNRGIHRPLATT